jgi:hypothetical protein
MRGTREHFPTLNWLNARATADDNDDGAIGASSALNDHDRYALPSGIATPEANAGLSTKALANRT